MRVNKGSLSFVVLYRGIGSGAVSSVMKRERINPELTDIGKVAYESTVGRELRPSIHLVHNGVIMKTWYYADGDPVSVSDVLRRM